MKREAIVQLYIKVTMQLEEEQSTADALAELDYTITLPSDINGEVTDSYINDYDIIKD